MIKNIDQSLAQQIVDTVKDVCGQDINFIEPSGIILASTNPKRIGMFHEIGQKAAATHTSIEVDSDTSYSGTQKGINMPIYHNQSILAVIGISGDPEEVRKYACLAERISNLLIREREVNAFSRNQADKKQFVIDSLIRKANVNLEYLKDCVKSFHVDLKTEKRLLLIHINPRYNPTNLSLLDQKIEQLFDQMHLTLYTFHYPNEYLAVLDADAFGIQSATIRKFAKLQQEILKLTVGKSTSLYQIADSYSSAVTAWKSISATEECYALFDDLTLEMILSDVSENSRETFVQKTIFGLSEEERTFVQAYFEENMSLIKTCEKLYLHKNTLQYKLNHIYKKCGLNPRLFQDAVLLYLALKLD
ncbi:MAG: sugar diacid recognition domain-containing protein [Hespellia sp.]|nr:sugar diacid recognition domain-containing protein [Hespellia sp.]